MCLLSLHPAYYILQVPKQRRKKEKKIIQTVIRKERGIGSREKRLIDHWLKGETHGQDPYYFFLFVSSRRRSQRDITNPICAEIAQHCTASKTERKSKQQYSSMLEDHFEKGNGIVTYRHQTSSLNRERSSRLRALLAHLSKKRMTLLP